MVAILIMTIFGTPGNFKSIAYCYEAMMVIFRVDVMSVQEQLLVETSPTRAS